MSKTIKLKSTRIFQESYQAFNNDYDTIVNQGGSRSSKTYSIAQLFVVLGHVFTNKVFTIARKTTPAVKATALRDFLEILQNNGIYDKQNYNKTMGEYILNGNLYEFIGVDDPQKIRGRKRDFLWLNEANEFKHEDYKQLEMRTVGQKFLDYNPSDEFHWIYDDILPRKDCKFIKSTYLDNPFLEQRIIDKIEQYKNKDENYWRIYGLGEKGVSEASIYTHWQYVDKLPENYDERFYGLDFGWNHPTVLVEIRMKDDRIYCKQIIYEKYKTNGQIIDLMDKLGVDKNSQIFADSAEPDRINEIANRDYWCNPAKKDVLKGIDDIKLREFYITSDSVEGIKEVKSYKWQVKDEKVIDKPVKINDDFCDAVRYGVHSYLNASFVGIV